VQLETTDRYADLDGLRLHYVEAGTGPLVVLLHGFPEFWYSWRYQIPALKAAGYRVVAPDLRGYNLSGKPRGVPAYAANLVAWDIEQLIQACGADRAVLVGHDWGGAIGWEFAMRYPRRLERLVIMNAPHPVRFLRALRTWRQLRKSWYIFFFQLPWLPEAVIRADGFAFLRKTLKTGPLRAGAVTSADIERYVEAAAQPGALTAAINYYRAALRHGPSRGSAVIDAPVLVIWGEKDRFLGSELAEPDHRWVPNVRVERVPDAGHFVHLDQPERVNTLLLDFLRS
jgi:pimeloyl-ACP methyl ester carboxylesterase